MKNNVVGIDRGMRILLGAAVIAVGIFYQNYWAAIGLVPFLTGIIGWCPAYSFIGKSSCDVTPTEDHYEK